MLPKLRNEFLTIIKKVLNSFNKEHRELLVLDLENHIFDIRFKEPYEYFYFRINKEDVSSNSIYSYHIEFYATIERKTILAITGDVYTTFESYFKDWLTRAVNFIDTKKELYSLIPKSSKENITHSQKELLPITSYLSSFQIQNFFSIKDLEIKDLANKKEIYILGENGDGKTLLLQAITIAAQWHRILNEKEFGKTGEIMELAQKSNLDFRVQDSENNVYTKESEKSFYLANFFAYGVNRRAAQDAENTDNYGFLSLFSDQSVLKHPISLLKEIDRLESKKINRYLPLEKFKEIVANLLSESADFQIDTSGEEIIFWERGTKLDYKQLSEGYRSVMTWVMDLIFHLSENQPNAQNTEDFTGIVLVDEINLHLHPKWEYELPKKLRTWFPRIQFIFTTHSPITVLGASEDAVFFKLYKENGETKIIPYEELRVGNMRVDQILTSPFFGLQNARPQYLQEFMAEREKLLTKTDFSKEDEQKLAEMEQKYGALPTGETALELKTQLLLNKIIKNFEENDKN